VVRALETNKGHGLNGKDLLSHVKKYIVFLTENGFSETFRALLVETYFWFCVFFRGFSKKNKFFLKGFYFQSIPYDLGISTELRIYGDHEPLSSAILPMILKEGMVCIDIGANIGFYALIEGRIIGSAGRLYVIEPSPKASKFLIQNLTNNKINYTFKQIALADKNGFAHFIINKLSNLSQINFDAQNKPAVESIAVETMSLDGLMKEMNISKVDFLRMDVEGAELLIAKGWEKTIRCSKPLLFIEFHRKIGLKSIINMLSLLKEEGYYQAYYIQRSLNNCLIGKERDVAKISIENLIDDLVAGKMRLRDFHLITAEKGKHLY
jgi:FkbM family methyltransferase